LGDLISGKIQPRWLKLKDACAYAALGKARLKVLAQQGQVTGFPDPDCDRGDWIFDRLSLDTYREAQAGTNNIKEAVASLKQRLAG